MEDFSDAQKTTITIGDYIFNVLIYKERNEFISLALEADIAGYGHTIEWSLDELKSLLKQQIRYAEDRRSTDPKSLVYYHSDPEYFEIFHKTEKFFGG